MVRERRTLSTRARSTAVQPRDSYMSTVKTGRRMITAALGIAAAAGFVFACQAARPKQVNLATGDAASRVYVAPGQHDEFYSFLSGGFSGQVAVYGLPSGRLLKVVPVFSQNPE